MNLASPYNRKEYLNFLQNDFLTDSFILNEEEVKPEFKTNYISEVKLLGKDTDLELNVYEVKHNSVNDPRVGLSKESFRMMAQFSVRKALILFISENSDNYRLSLVTIDLKLEGDKVKKEYSNPRRYSFFLGPDAKLHTPEQFLISKGKVDDFEDLQSRFSVEVVNKEFYQQIALKFTELTGGKRKVGSRVEDFRRKLSLPSVTEPEVFQEFAVRLIGRLVFCWFLKMKKSEAGIPLIPEEVLSLEAAKSSSGYYHEVLEKLFFEMLNTDIDDREDEFKKEPYSLIPFLNGGLFTPHQRDYYETYKSGVSKHLNTLKIPDTWLREFIEILETYNFTVDENTSVDIDLSVDPEMLGRIFENLLAEINPETGESARKATGSYYTPRPIVEYMVDESLKQYLVTETQVEEEMLSQLLSYTDEGIELTNKQKQKIVDALDKVKILDPACGSGAFPIGVLQKMLLILQKVDPNSELWLDKQLRKIDIAALRNELKRKLIKDNVDYIHKLGIIQNSIYGVDIQPIAGEISKLRCFLSLVVDELVEDRKKNRGILPLPNLEFKFVAANTLIGLPEKQEQEDMFNVDDEVSELEEIRKQYFTSTGNKKKALEEKFIDTQKKLAKNFISKNAKDERALKLTNWNPFSDEPSDWFDINWMFGTEQGFDIVIGNPPYVFTRKSDFTDDFKSYVQRKYLSRIRISGQKTKANQSGKINLYGLFILSGERMLKRNGILTFIIPNNLLRATIFNELRHFLLKNTLLNQIVDLGSGVFEDVTASTIVFMVENKKKEDYPNHRVQCISNIKSLLGKNFKVNLLPQNRFSKNVSFIINMHTTPEDLDVLTKINESEKILGQYCDEIIEGIVAHKNLISETQKKGYLPLIEGKCIKPYLILEPNKYIKWNKKAIHRTRPDFVWEAPKKICIQRISGGNTPLVAAVDSNQFKTFASVNNLLLKKEYEELYDHFVALINSKLINWYYAINFTNRSELTVNISKTFLEQLPVRPLKDNAAKKINKLVEDISTEKKRNNTSSTIKIENEVDIIIYKLYKLTFDEVKVIDPGIEKIISKKEYENFEIG